MEKVNKVLKIITQIICGILIFVSLCSIAVFIYFKTIGKEYVPSAMTSTYVTLVKDPLSGEEKPFMEANFYEYVDAGKDFYENFENGNASNGKFYNALQVLELRINSYSGTDKQAIYSRGYQLVAYSNDSIFAIGNVPIYCLYCYDSYDGVSFPSYKQIAEDTDFTDDRTYIADINGETFGVRLDGKYIEIEESWFGLVKEEVEVQYDMYDFMYALMRMIKGSSNGTGQSRVPLADLGNYFSLYKEENGKFEGTPVSFNTESNAYFTIDTYYNKRGLTSYKQSLFGSVLGNSSFNMTGIPEDIDYWKDTTTRVLNNSHFTTRTEDDKKYISLDLDLVQELSQLKDIEIEITINVDNITGLDYYGLCGLKIKKLNLVSNKVVNFELLNGALKDTGLEVSGISTTNVTIVNLEVAS